MTDKEEGKLQEQSHRVLTGDERKELALDRSIVSLSTLEKGRLTLR